MTPKGLAFVLAAAVVVGACGGVARPESRVSQPEPAVAESPDNPVGMTQSQTTGMPPSSTTAPKPVPTVVEDVEPSSSTTSTTLADDRPASTTTSPTESISLEEVRDALDALDALLGDLDSHIGSVDLDEGETP